MVLLGFSVYDKQINCHCYWSTSSHTFLLEL